MAESTLDLDASHSAAPDCRMILLGRTGSGKSSTGNTVLGQHVFKAKVSPASVTLDCLLVSKVREGKTVHVVDTPGIFDTTSNKFTTREIATCVKKSLPHAFILVTHIGRFTPEDKQTFDTLEQLFGEDMYRFSIVLFTGKDAIDSEEMTLQQYIEESPPALYDILKKCEMRYLAFNNKGPADARDAMCRELLRMIDNLVAANHGSYYTNALYEKAELAMTEKTRKTIDESLVKLESMPPDGEISREDKATIMAELLTVREELKSLGTEKPMDTLDICFSFLKNALPIVSPYVVSAIFPASPPVVQIFNDKLCSAIPK